MQAKDQELATLQEKYNKLKESFETAMICYNRLLIEKGESKESILASNGNILVMAGLK